MFSTPKRALASSVCILAIVCILGIGAVFAASTIAEKNSIGVVNAQKYAFADAGISESDVAYSAGKFGFEDGQFVFKIEFVSEGIEYDYIIKASDGKVISKNAANNSNASQTGSMLSLDEAVDIALLNSGLSNDEVNITASSLSKDDGIYMYFICFSTTENKYEYKINAYTGAIFSMSRQPASSTGGNNSAGNTEIGAGTAKNYALADAGVSESSALFTKVKLEKDDGISVYKIEFSTQFDEYEYKIDAYTGNIIEKKVESISSGQTQQPVELIGIDAAKKYALSDASLSGEQVTYTKAEFEYDDGLPVYEIEFFTVSLIYEYEINGYTGAVLSKKTELIESGSGNGGNTSTAYISVDEAKNIALSHAGFSLSEVTFSKTKLERDDGIMIYEIEFYKGRVEYEYEINALTGDIIEFDTEM